MSVRTYVDDLNGMYNATENVSMQIFNNTKKFHLK